MKWKSLNDGQSRPMTAWMTWLNEDRPGRNPTIVLYFRKEDVVSIATDLKIDINQEKIEFGFVISDDGRCLGMCNPSTNGLDLVRAGVRPYTSVKRSSVHVPIHHYPVELKGDPPHGGLPVTVRREEDGMYSVEIIDLFVIDAGSNAN